MKRENGYYWVRRVNTWFVGRWDSKYELWSADGYPDNYGDWWVDEVGEKIDRLQSAEQHKKTRYAAIDLVREEMDALEQDYLANEGKITMYEVRGKMNRLIKNIQNLPQ